MKHKLKMILRESWARLLFHTGLHRLMDRMMPQRMTILTSHCVEHVTNDFLPADMKISEARLVDLLSKFSLAYDWVTVGRGWKRLQEGGGDGRSMVALSIDDGYLDNLEQLLPILVRHGATATIYLESRPMDGREVNWTHKFFWLLARISPAELVERYLVVSEDEKAKSRLSAVLSEGGRLEYTLKKVLKYEADQADVEASLTKVFVEEGGDEAALCSDLYLSWDHAKQLEQDGIELGGHTVHHWVLSGLDAEGQKREVAEGKQQLAQHLEPQESFAYPFGRHWDWNKDTVEAVRAAGFTTAATTHAGTNTIKTDPYRLKRWMIDDHTPMHLMVCELCGGFDFLRKFGLDLSE